MTTVIYDTGTTPRVTLSLESGVYTAVLEVEGLDPQRGTTAEERSEGISSLDPPTVSADNYRDLIDRAQRAVGSSIESTLGENGGAGEITMVYYRVAKGVRQAIRLLGEDI